MGINNVYAMKLRYKGDLSSETEDRVYEYLGISIPAGKDYSVNGSELDFEILNPFALFIALQDTDSKEYEDYAINNVLRVLDLDDNEIGSINDIIPNIITVDSEGGIRSTGIIEKDGWSSGRILIVKSDNSNVISASSKTIDDVITESVSNIERVVTFSRLTTSSNIKTYLKVGEVPLSAIRGHRVFVPSDMTGFKLVGFTLMWGGTTTESSNPNDLIDSTPTIQKDGKTIVIEILKISGGSFQTPTKLYYVVGKNAPIYEDGGEFYAMNYTNDGANVVTDNILNINNNIFVSGDLSVGNKLTNNGTNDTTDGDTVEYPMTLDVDINNDEIGFIRAYADGDGNDGSNIILQVRYKLYKAT